MGAWTYLTHADLDAFWLPHWMGAVLRPGLGGAMDEQV